MQVRNYTLLQIYSPNLLVFFSLIDMIRVHLLCRHLLCVLKKKSCFMGKISVQHDLLSDILGRLCVSAFLGVLQ